MARKPINWLVEENDVKEFIKPINIEIPIEKGQYNYIFNSSKKANDFKKYEELIVNRLFDKLVYDNYRKILNSKISLSYIPDFKNDNWIIGYSPVEIYNAIFETLNINDRIDYIDYSNQHQINRVLNLVKVRLIEEQLQAIKSKDYVRNYFIDDALEAIDKIMLFNGFDIESRLTNSVTYKNLLYYLSVKSLDLLDETDNILYIFLPKQYYEEVSSKKKAQFPNQLFMDYDRVYSYNYSNYDLRFEDVMLRYPSVFEGTIGMDEIAVMDKLEILKNDLFINDIEYKYSYYKKKKDYTKTDEELSDMLKDKMSFYKQLLSMKDDNGNSIVVSPVKGLNDLYGYYGFVLNNNYIILYKFYN